MTQTLTSARLIAALKRVPEKSFRIMELAPQLVDDKGKVDVIKAVDRQAELNLAIAEVESYVKDVHDTVRVLQHVGDRPVGDETDDDMEAEE